jgi:CDP-diglyceride synthetase
VCLGGHNGASGWQFGRSGGATCSYCTILIHALAILEWLGLIGAANGAPVLCKRFMKMWFAWPIDGGIILYDGHPLLGRSKTWRGVVAAVLLTLSVAVLIGLPWQAGPVVASSAMVGDCTSSFIKRRLGIETSSMAIGLDQVPESLLPAVAGIIFLPFGTIDIIAIVLAFIVAELGLSRLLFALGLRDRPY